MLSFLGDSPLDLTSLDSWNFPASSTPLTALPKGGTLDIVDLAFSLKTDSIPPSYTEKKFLILRIDDVADEETILSNNYYSQEVFIEDGGKIFHCFYDMQFASLSLEVKWTVIMIIISNLLWLIFIMILISIWCSIWYTICLYFLEK